MAADIATNFTKLGRYPLDILLNVINASLIAYVILRYKLLDINIIIRKGLVYFPLTGIIASVYLFTIFILERLLRGALGISLVAILIAIGIAFVFQPLRDYLQRRIERLFFRERFDYYQTLREFARRVVTILDLNELIDSTMNIVSETMQTDKVGVFLIDKDGFYLKGFTGLKESNLSQFKLKKDNPLVIWLGKNGKILARDRMSVFSEFKSLRKRGIGDLEMLKAELFVPLKFKDNLVGIVVLGRKLSESVYYEEDLALLSPMADQAAIAFENARLYEEIRQALRKKGELEKKLRQQHEQLVRTERLRALGEMAGGVAHDFNNLLAIILGNAQLLERGVRRYKEEEIKERLRIIARTAYEGGETVRRLQHFTRREVYTEDFTRIDLNEIIRSAITSTSPRWKDKVEVKGITIKIKEELGKLRVWVSRCVMGSSNAIKER